MWYPDVYPVDTMGSKVDDMIAKLLVEVLLPIIREPVYEEINSIFEGIHGNASTLPTTLIRGAHGKIGLIMNPTLYRKITQTAYAETKNPGKSLNTSGTVTAAECAQQWNHKAVSKEVYENHFNMNADLKILTIKTVED